MKRAWKDYFHFSFPPFRICLKKNKQIKVVSNTVFAILFSVTCLTAQEQSIPYSQADRDRMARMETQIESIQLQTNRMEDKFDSYFMWGFGLVLMSIFGLFGFIIYDRRTTLSPVENKNERILKALKEAAENDSVLREALKKTALWSINNTLPFLR